jgi:DNA-binding response OmpR family regulator
VAASDGPGDEPTSLTRREAPASSDPVWLEFAILDAESRPACESEDRRDAWGIGGATVVVIARDADIRAYVRDCLCATGLRIIEAADLVTAVRVSARATPDLLILDVSTPGTETSDVEMLPLSSLVRLPRIVIADEPPEPASGSGPAADAAAVLVKPFNARRLQHEVRRCLERCAGWPTETPPEER